MTSPIIERERCDLLIIGGGVAGCYAAAKAREANSSLDVLVMEKAATKRSGAACRGMDAINVVVIPSFSPPQTPRHHDPHRLEAHCFACTQTTRVRKRRVYAILNNQPTFLQSWSHYHTLYYH